MITFHEKDLQKLGFTFDPESNSLQYYSDLILEGNIETNTNLKFDCNFRCNGFIRAKEISVQGNIIVDGSLSCDNIEAETIIVYGDLLYVPKSIVCSSSLVSHGKITTSRIYASSLTSYNSVDALEISAKKLSLHNGISCNSLTTK